MAIDPRGDFRRAEVAGYHRRSRPPSQKVEDLKCAARSGAFLDRRYLETDLPPRT